MRIVKISLAIAVIGIISFFVIQSLGGSPKIDKVAPPGNPFTQKIEQEIKSLGNLPENKFCNVKYNEVKYYIDDYYKSQLLGKNKYENNQWKEILSKNLYSVYSSKFIKQSYYVFNNSEWNIQSIAFIRSECITLRKSEFLEKGSPIDNSYSKIQLILSKYDEINNFVASCKGFSYSDYSLNSTYPLLNIKQKIARVALYKKNKLENDFVNNCVRIHNQLNEIQQSLFNSHYKYLLNKFRNWQELYSQYNSFNEYRSILFMPLKRELDLMDNTIYLASDFKNKHDNLEDILQTDSRNAYNHFN
jgi:hypothetical protein